MKKGAYLRANHSGEVERQSRTFRRMGNSHEQFFRMLEKHVGLDKKSSVLEIGCGCGLMLGEVHSRWGCKGEGWDNNESYLEAASRLFPKLRFCRVGFMDPLPSSQKFDLIIFREALMECSRPEKVLEWGSRYLKNGGWICSLEPDYGATIMYPEIPGWNAFLEMYRRYCKSNGEEFFMGRRLLSSYINAGLREINIQPIHETHTGMDKNKFREFMEIEAYSIESDMVSFAKSTGIAISQIKKIIASLRQLPRRRGSYLQTLMIGICGRI